ncbi:ATP-binding protein [Nocardioides caldifontis]|uniref:ATP-binding protein n=1 Tax=Nocardioides caldifontis TaxID=2588938 RepID=UPI0011DF671F|nr:ATP-binding protein [Nocardioides caldifontis]
MDSNRGRGEPVSVLLRRWPPQPTAASHARRDVREWLVGAVPAEVAEELVDDVTLLVSELVTNAVVHAGTDIELTCAVLEDGGVRVEVDDASSHLPSARSYGSRAGTGRGLRLLQDLADTWGADATRTGKRVWFELGASSAGTTPGRRARRAAEGPPLTRSQPEEPGTVHLLGMPLLLYRAWVQHAETLLREYLLVCLGSEPAEDAIQVHADASEAIAVLEEHVPVLELSADPDQALQATEPHVTAERVQVSAHPKVADKFATLDKTLDAALTLAAARELLNPPTQPELVALRMWLCEEFVKQLAGARPTPWDAHERGHQADTVPLEHLDLPELGEIRDADVPMLAADDHGTIVAASFAAATLLGYPSAADLEGTRLIGIIPPRYRQAHLAGFTLHQLTGRAPLVGRPVQVPVLCRDGAEVPVLVTISLRRRQSEEPLFVAALSGASQRR